MTKSKNRNNSKRQGLWIVVSAPSGSGKTTLVKRLLHGMAGLRFSISHTTRPPRTGEVEGRDYFFISEKQFKGMIERREFAEWAKVFGHYYGTSWKQLREAQSKGVDLLLDIDVQGWHKLRRRLREAISIFILPPSFDALVGRLRGRAQDAPEDIARRLETSKQEVAHWREYDYLVVNDAEPRATEALRTIILAARCRRTAQQSLAKQILESFGG